MYSVFLNAADSRRRSNDGLLVFVVIPAAAGILFARLSLAYEHFS